MYSCAGKTYEGKLTVQNNYELNESLKIMSIQVNQLLNWEAKMNIIFGTRIVTSETNVDFILECQGDQESKASLSHIANLSLV